MGGPRAIGALLAPQLRGRMRPWMLDLFRDDGWHVHQVGAAAYVHRDDLHLVVGVWAQRSPAPSWAPRLGRPSAAYERRCRRVWQSESWRRMVRRPDGTFWARRPWFLWPLPRAYRWEP